MILKEKMIAGYINNIHKMAEGDPYTFAVWVLVIMAIEGIILGFLAEKIFMLLGIEIEEISHH